MLESVNAFAAWQNFYMIVGSSAGALTGLQFVVMALVADLPVRRAGIETTDAFSTPTIVHFGAVLLLAGILSAPWHGLRAPALLLALAGVCLLAYVIVVAGRARRQTAYEPVFEDWLFHVLLPAVAYGIWAAAGYALLTRADEALFGIAAVSMLLLFVGIHNAWDSVTYMVFLRPREPKQDTTRPS